MSDGRVNTATRRNKPLVAFRRLCSECCSDALEASRPQRRSSRTWKVLFGLALFLLAVLSITWTFMATEKRGAAPLPSSSKLQSKHTP